MRYLALTLPALPPLSASAAHALRTLITGLAAILSVASAAGAQQPPAPLRSPASIRPTTADLDTIRLTSGRAWRRTVSPHFVVYREQPVSGTSVTATIDSLEAAWTAAVTLLGRPVAETPRAHVFVTASRTRFAGFVPPEAKGVTTQLRTGDDIILMVQNDSVRLYSRHEVMHLVAVRAWGPSRAAPWLVEGLATFADGRCQSSTVVAMSRDLLEARPALRAQDVVERFLDLVRTERGAAYVLAGSLVDYLWTSRGREGVHRLWMGRDSLSENAILPGTGGELTRAWRMHVAQKAGATPGLSTASFLRAACG